jgi:hypothetical protein
MSNTNDFLPFCYTDTGTNLVEQADYITDSQRPIGNQTGIARSPFVNKALRQSAYITANLAQLVSDVTTTDVLDNATPVQILQQMKAALLSLPPYAESLTTSGTWNSKFYFFTASANATAGAVYTNNSTNFTVVNTVSAGMMLFASGSGFPTTSGVLTKSSGTGDATITFYAIRSPLFLNVKLVGAGAGGAGAGVPTGNAGTNATGSSFGTSLLSATGGVGGAAGGGDYGGLGGIGTIASPAYGLASAGNSGGGSNTAIVTIYVLGGSGGQSPFGGAVGSSPANNAGSTAVANTGSGGSGGSSSGALNVVSGAGGGSGGYVDAIIPSPSASYPFVIGAAGSGGAAGTNGFPGGSGSDGFIEVLSIY